jgi:hypothetical protein
VHSAIRFQESTRGCRRSRARPCKIVGNSIQYSYDGQGCPSNWVGMYDARFTAAPLALVKRCVEPACENHVS